MKKSKILVLTLAFALLVCAMFAITASADEGGNLAILSKNVAYSSNVQMMFAVDATVEEAGDVVVKYYFESEPEKIYTAALNDVTNPDTIYTDKNGVQHPSFTTIGIPAKEYGEKVYVAAQMKGASDDAEYVEYSVAEYFFEKLYAQSYVFETSGEDYNRKQLYVSYLNCGAYAQQVLINDKNNMNETLVTDYNYVALSGGVTGAESGFYADGAEVELALGDYTGEVPANMQFDAWQLYKFASFGAEPTVTELSGNSYTLTADATYVVAPVFAPALPGGNGAYYNAHKNGTETGTVYDFADGDISVLAGISGGAQSSATVLSDSKYVSFAKTAETSSTVKKGLAFDAAGDTTSTVIEMDIRLSGDVNGISPLFVIEVENRGYTRQIYVGVNADGKIIFPNGTKDAAESYVAFDADKWHNVRLVISASENANTTETGYADLYVDNEYACKVKLNGKGTTTKDRLVFTINGKGLVGNAIEFDNVFVGHN